MMRGFVRATYAATRVRRWVAGAGTTLEGRSAPGPLANPAAGLEQAGGASVAWPRCTGSAPARTPCGAARWRRPRTAP
jgi:hypothetical protein